MNRTLARLIIIAAISHPTKGATHEHRTAVDHRRRPRNHRPPHLHHPPLPLGAPAMSKYAKALWAFASTVIGALIIAVSATPNHSLKDVGTLGWLVLAASVLATTGGVYGVANSPPAPPAPPAV